MSKRRLPDFGDRETRLRTARERFGCALLRCALCPEAHPLRLEQHHPAQRMFDQETIPLCASHHRDASDWQRDHPNKIEGCTSNLEPMGHWLYGLGDLLRIASEEDGAVILREFLGATATRLHDIGHALIEVARSTVGKDQP